MLLSHVIFSTFTVLIKPLIFGIIKGDPLRLYVSTTIKYGKIPKEDNSFGTVMMDEKPERIQDIANSETDIEKHEVVDESNKVQEELKQLKNQVLRLAAELQNVKKRAEKEKLDASKFAISSFAKDILTVRDSLQLALDNCKNTENKIVEGIRLTLDIMDKTLDRQGITMIKSLGMPFDPNIHQAMKQIESDKPQGTIVAVMQEGFVLNQRLLRPALVSVAK